MRKLEISITLLPRFTQSFQDKTVSLATGLGTQIILQEQKKMFELKN